jgi:hypothetical protein
VGGYVAGEDLPITVYEDRVVIGGIEIENPMLELAVTATDDVNNQRTWDFEFSILDFVLHAKMYVTPVLRDTSEMFAAALGRIESYPILREEGTLKPVLRSIMEIRKEDE